MLSGDPLTGPRLVCRLSLIPAHHALRRLLVEHAMTFVGEHRDIIPHLHKSQIDQLPEMIRVDRKQCPLRLDVPKSPNGVDGPKGLTPDTSPRLSFIT